jgi:ATP/maltotriose-dependent transcriptional regulator MalT
VQAAWSKRHHDTFTLWSPRARTHRGDWLSCARAELAEIRLADLRFAPDEADRFLTSTMGLQLSPSDRAALLALTEGWAAGLHLAALAVRGQAGSTPHQLPERHAALRARLPD